MFFLSSLKKITLNILSKTYIPISPCPSNPIGEFGVLHFWSNKDILLIYKL